MATVDDNIGDNVNRSSSNYVGETVKEETVEFYALPQLQVTPYKGCSSPKRASYRPVRAPIHPEPEQRYFRRCLSCLSMFSTSRDDDSTMVEDEYETVQEAESTRRSWLGYEGVLAEIVKSIVYGGLIETIVSLSVVVSAAASDVTTLSVVALALASLIGGVFIIGHNLWDLRADCYKASASQETRKAATNKYKELLGEVNYFPLHTVFAILSYLAFGVVPPVVYRFVYHQIHDKDLTLVVVAAVSLLCVALLAVVKAYISKFMMSGYFKVVVYYVMLTVSVSGVCYVVGSLVTRWTKELGWFNPSSGGGTGTPCIPRATDPYLEAF